MQVRGEGQLARYNLGLAFRQKGYYAEALREYQIGARARRGTRSRAAGDGRGAPADARARRGGCELYDELLERDPASPKLWNERGVALHQDGRFADAEASYRRAIARRAVVRDRAQQPRRRALSPRRRRRGARRRSASRSTRAGVRQGAAQPRAAAQQAEAVAAGARGVSVRC